MEVVVGVLMILVKKGGGGWRVGMLRILRRRVGGELGDLEGLEGVEVDGFKF